MGRRIEDYEHKDNKKLNNPDVGLVNASNDSNNKKTLYAYDPHLDPELNSSLGRHEIEKLLAQIQESETLEEAKAHAMKLQKMQDPYLNWAGKAERTSFAIDTVSLHVHERIGPKSILNAVTRVATDYETTSLFANLPKAPLREAIQFYKHKQGWKNRLIAGDSLLVMNSLIQKEGMEGEVQMVYIDPPYGIKYGSNFQPFVGKRDVKDGKDEDLTSEPEQIKAFRDTWELGIHSYLAYLRDRLLLARELLSETGSCFVQISDENVHLVRNLMDEVFGRENFVSLITFRKTSRALGSKLIGIVTDYIVWYAKNKPFLKYHNILEEKDIDQNESSFQWINDNGDIRKSDSNDIVVYKNTKDVMFFTPIPLASSGYTTTCTYDFNYQNKKYSASTGNSWKTTKIGLERVIKVDRIIIQGKTPFWIQYLSELLYTPIDNIWNDTRGDLQKIYVVQTTQSVIQRCLLMTTDPGDLVLDITCGSGTTAFCAEKWGRRWITCDTSRVALAIARQRLTTAMFDYYTLKDEKVGVDSGFIYKTVPHITLKSIANNEEIDKIWDKRHPDIEKALADLNSLLKTDLKEWEVPFEPNKSWPDKAINQFERFRKLKREMQAEMDASIARRADQETLYDQPVIDKTKVRVTGPFTVEAVPAMFVQPVEELKEEYDELDESLGRSGETSRQKDWRDEILRTGIRGKGSQKIELATIEPLPSYTYLHALAETKDGKRMVLSFGPEHKPLDQRQVEVACQEAKKIPKPDFVAFCAFQFDPEAAKDIDEIDADAFGFQLLKVSMNPDLQTGDLKKKRVSNESFWLVGSPDVKIIKDENEQIRVEVLGFDYYDTIKSEIISGGKDKIACWMLDPDFDERSICPTQIFFPLADTEQTWGKLKRNLKAELDQEKMQAFFGTVSLPFKSGKKIAVKIIDNRGIESLKIVEVSA